MDVRRIVSELKAETDRIRRAITLLEGSSVDSSSIAKPRAAAPTRRAASVRQPTTFRKGRHSLTPEGRRKLSQSMKHRWAERRKKRAKRMTQLRSKLWG